MFAGLRPLVKAKTRKTASLSRDHLITITPSNLITVTGGKWTTCRKMAEDVIDIASHSAQLSRCPCTTMDLSLELNQSFVPPSIERTNENDLRQFVKTAVWEEMCMQPEDFLSRRSRQLLLDAKIAIEKTPAVTKYIAEELGKDEVWIAEQINNFHNIAKNYLPRGNS
jgi:glycerol-3-phosphate dehydrogenase